MRAEMKRIYENKKPYEWWKLGSNKKTSTGGNKPNLRSRGFNEIHPSIVFNVKATGDLMLFFV